MNIRFYNAKILTLEEDFTVITGEVWVKGTDIVFVGETGGPPLIYENRLPKWDREIDVMGNLLMPGFKNAHSHSPMTFLRSFADDLPLSEWLNKKIFPAEAKLTLNDVYYFSKIAIMEYLTSGITANFDMYFMQGEVVRASIDCGFRTVLCSGLNDFTDSIDRLELLYDIYNNTDPLISYKLGFHAEYTTNIELLKEVVKLSHVYKAPVFTHNSETINEVEGCKQRHNLTPTAFLDSLGMFEYGGGGFHCVHLSDEDLDIFQKRNLHAITNPAANLKLASGVAPISKMLTKGISIGIGTDGPAGNNCLDIFREMFLVTGLQKMKEKDAAAVDGNQVLRMATIGSADAMGLTRSRTLSVGQYADMIMLDLNQPNMQPLNDIAKNIVYSGSKQNVKMTMVNGKILYENGCFHIGEKPEDIYAYCNNAVKRLQS